MEPDIYCDNCWWEGSCMDAACFEHDDHYMYMCPCCSEPLTWLEDMPLRQFFDLKLELINGQFTYFVMQPPSQ